jgi:hypothetical protein
MLRILLYSSSVYPAQNSCSVGTSGVVGEFGPGADGADADGALLDDPLPFPLPLRLDLGDLDDFPPFPLELGDLDDFPTFPFELGDLDDFPTFPFELGDLDERPFPFELEELKELPFEDPEIIFRRRFPVFFLASTKTVVKFATKQMAIMIVLIYEDFISIRYRS